MVKGAGDLIMMLTARANDWSDLGRSSRLSTPVVDMKMIKWLEPPRSAIAEHRVIVILIAGILECQSMSLVDIHQ